MLKACSYSWIPDELPWLWKQVRPFLRWNILSFLCTVFGTLLGLFNPLVMKWFIDQVLPHKDFTWLLVLVALLFFSYQAKTLLNSLGAYLTLNAAQQMTIRLRMRVLRHLDLQSANYYETTPIGSAIYPLKEPIEEIAYFGSDLLPCILRVLLTTCFTLAAMLMLSARLTVTVIPLFPVFLIARRYFRHKLRVDSDAVQQGRLVWNEFLQEHIPAVNQLQLLRQERRQERRAFRFLSANIRLERKLFRTGSWFSLFNSFFLVLAMSWVLGFGGWRVMSGVLSVGSLIAFYAFVTQLFEPLSSAAEIYARLQRTFASIRQVQAVLNLRPRITNFSCARRFDEKRLWQIDLDSVEFAYRRQKGILQIPILRIASGTQIAITGENGAGKSTFGKLLARIYDVDSGSITIGGEDVRQLQLASLRRCVSYQPRDPTLFGLSIADNLRLGKASASLEELRDVIDLVGLTEVVAKFPEGLDQTAGPGGCQLSGGERQRFAIARALLVRPNILILDEATSCLDAESEEAVLDGIRHYLPASTIIVVSHRLSTIVRFNRILSLSSGQITFDGNPDAWMLGRNMKATAVRSAD
jgi:ABC-type bacteriocin/lantibiotic exporter with double-glycine peptidase domain